MKIGYITRLLSQQGAPRTATLTCISLTKAGHDTTSIYVREANGLNTYKDILKKCRYSILYSSKYSGLFTRIYSIISSLYMYDRGGNLRVDYDLLKRAAKDIKEKKFEYVIAQNIWAGVTAYQFYRKSKTPYSVIIQENLQEYSTSIIPNPRHPFGGLKEQIIDRMRKLVGFFVSRMELKILANALTIFSTTEMISRSIIRKYPFLANKVRINYHGLDYIQSIQDSRDDSLRGYTDRKNKIIIDSQWDVGRHPEIYCEIAKRLPEYSFVMSGGWRDPTLKKEFLKKLQDMNIKNLHLLTNYSQLELVKNFETSKFAIRFGFREHGISQAFLIATSAGTPVIVNRDIGASELIDKFGGGVVLSKPLDIIDTIRKIDNEVTYDTLQSELAHIRVRFSWDEHAKKLLSAFDESITNQQ